MTTPDRADAMPSTGSLTCAELEQARQRLRADPEAIWPAICAALGIERGEATLDGMQEILGRVKPCTT